MAHGNRLAGGLAALLLLFAVPATAGVVRFEITDRSPFADGHEFGETGPYERIVGRVHYAIDPEDPANAAIVDLQYAPRNEDGLVEFSTDLFILAPKDPRRGNGSLLYDVNNRGNKRVLRDINDGGGGNDPADRSHAGNGFLMRRGFTIVWSGWVGELQPGNDRLLLHAPVARRCDEKPITGPVRYEILLQQETDRTTVAPANHGAYRPTERGLEQATLTWRRLPGDPRVPIPGEQFRLHVQQGKEGLAVVELEKPAGLQAGLLYELVYEAHDPIVQGVGFAGVRDLISALKHGEGADNPFVASQGGEAGSVSYVSRRGGQAGSVSYENRSPYDRAIGFGTSQSGRFLREMLYWGLNVDERARQVFDGLIPHVSGAGLGSFNHRFARPGLYAGQYERHDTPSDRFPFSYGTIADPLTGRVDGIQRRAEAAGSVPRIMHTQSSVEYWSRANSLVHTDPLGQRDLVLPDNVRVYAFGGTQHVPSGYPPSRSIGQLPNNPADYRPLLRAVVDNLDRWIRTGDEPPCSVHPSIAGGTLVDFQQQEAGFPFLPGVRYPQVMHQPALLDYGSRWCDQGIIDRQPPRIAGRYRARVPAYDADGNERDCLLPPEVGVPLATFTGWNLRTADTGAPDQLVGLNGAYIPFPATKQERRRLGDPRSSVQERYGSLDEYMDALRSYCRDLVTSRYLLEEDKQRILDRQKERARPFFEGD